jgi:Arc/MetJ-type ribon-helix-helix transcriptional regulator
MSDDKDPLEDLFVEAQQQKEQFTETMQRLKEVKGRLRGLVDDLEEEEAIDESDAEEIRALIADGKYGDAREAIRDARAAYKLEFDDEEKDLFARRFEEAWQEHVAAVEQVRSAMVDFSGDIRRKDVIDLLYGKYSGLNKGDIRAVFDAFDDVEKTGLSPKQMARILQAYKHDLKIRTTTEVIEAIKREAER